MLFIINIYIYYYIIIIKLTIIHSIYTLDVCCSSLLLKQMAHMTTVLERLCFVVEGKQASSDMVGYFSVETVEAFENLCHQITTEPEFGNRVQKKYCMELKPPVSSKWSKPFRRLMGDSFLVHCNWDGNGPLKNYVFFSKTLFGKNIKYTVK